MDGVWSAREESTSCPLRPPARSVPLLIISSPLRPCPHVFLLTLTSSAYPVQLYSDAYTLKDPACTSDVFAFISLRVSCLPAPCCLHDQPRIASFSSMDPHGQPQLPPDSPLMNMSNSFLNEGMLLLSIPGPSRDPTYYIHDGNSVLLVENTLFKVCTRSQNRGREA